MLDARFIFTVRWFKESARFAAKLKAAKAAAHQTEERPYRCDHSEHQCHRCAVVDRFSGADLINRIVLKNVICVAPLSSTHRLCVQRTARVCARCTPHCTPARTRTCAMEKDRKLTEHAPLQTVHELESGTKRDIANSSVAAGKTTRLKPRVCHSSLHVNIQARRLLRDYNSLKEDLDS